MRKRSPLTPCRACAQSVTGWLDIWYAEQTDEVVFWSFTDLDYSSAYYY